MGYRDGFMQIGKEKDQVRSKDAKLKICHSAKEAEEKKKFCVRNELGPHNNFASGITAIIKTILLGKFKGGVWGWYRLLWITEQIVDQKKRVGNKKKYMANGLFLKSSCF